MKKINIIIISAAILSSLTLTGCDNKKDIRHNACSKAILDFQQATMQGDKDIDVKSANDVINKYNCTNDDVTSGERESRQEYLSEHPIKNKTDPTANFKNGKDWSKPWNNNSVHYDSSGKRVN